MDIHLFLIQILALVISFFPFPFFSLSLLSCSPSLELAEALKETEKEKRSERHCYPVPAGKKLLHENLYLHWRANLP